MYNKIVWCALGASSLLALPSAYVFAGDANFEDNDGLETIVVTADRSSKAIIDVPAHVTSIEMEKLSARGFRVGGDEFRAEAGINFRRGEGDNDEFTFVNFRGITGKHGNDTFLALVDGIPFVSADEEVLLSEVPYAAVGRVEFVRGPVSTLYGRGGISGAVNYRTLDLKAEPGGHISAAYGSDDFFNINGTYSAHISDSVRLLLSANYENAEGWRDNNAREITSLFAKAEFDLSDQTLLTVWAQYIDRTSENGSVIPLTPEGNRVNVAGGRKAYLGYGNARSELESYFGALRLNHSFNEQYDLEITTYARHKKSDVVANFYDHYGFDAENNIFTVNGFSSPNDADQWFAEGIFTANYSGHTVKVGASYEHSTIDEVDLWSGQNGFTAECGFAFYSIQIDYSTGHVLNGDHSCFARNQKLADDQGTNKFLGLFVQDEIELTDQLTLTLGVRYDSFKRDVDFASTEPFTDFQNITDKADAFSPKASLAYKLNTMMLYASYGRGFTSNFGPLWQWDPLQYIRDTRPSKLDSFEIGVKGTAADNTITYQLALYYLKQNDRAVNTPNPAAATDFAAPLNIATSGQEYSSKGLEASIEVRPVASTLIALSYAHTDATWDKFELTGTGEFTGNKPRGIAPHTIWASLQHSFTDAIQGEVTYEWYDDYYVTFDNTVKNGSYGLLGANISYATEWLGGVSLNLSATNLLNNEYYFYHGGTTVARLAVPGVPRQVRLSVRKNF